MLTEISDLLTVLPKVVEKVIKNVPPLKARALFVQRELKLFIALIRLQGSLPSRVWQRLSGHLFVASVLHSDEVHLKKRRPTRC